MPVEIFGLRWGVDLSALEPDHPELVEHLCRLWSRAAVDPDGTELPFVVALPGTELPVDDNDIARGCIFRQRDGFAYVLSKALTLASVSARRGSALMLHAAAFAVPASAASHGLLLVGPSGAGKSTASATLGKRWGYLSDETAVIEPDMTISPYAKPISLISDSRAPDKDEYSPDDLGLQCPQTPCRVGAVVFLDRVDEPCSPEVTRIGLVDGIMEALPQTSSLQALDHPLRRLAEALSSGGGPYRLTYHDVDGIDGAFTELVSSWRDYPPIRSFDHDDPAQARIVEHPPAAGSSAPSATNPSPASSGGAQGQPRWRRASWVDALQIGEELVVLREEKPARLSGIGATIWLHSADLSTAAQIEAAAVAQHGAHPQQRSKVRDAIAQLEHAGLLLGDVQDALDATASTEDDDA